MLRWVRRGTIFKKLAGKSEGTNLSARQRTNWLQRKKSE